MYFRKKQCGKRYGLGLFHYFPGNSNKYKEKLFTKSLLEKYICATGKPQLFVEEINDGTVVAERGYRDGKNKISDTG